MRMAKWITCAALMLLIACAPSFAQGTVSFQLTCTDENGSYLYTLANDSSGVSITLAELGIWGEGDDTAVVTGSADGWGEIIPPEDYWWVAWNSESNTPGVGDPPASGFALQTTSPTCPHDFEVTYYLDDSFDLSYFRGVAQCSEPAVPEPSAIVSLLSLVTGFGALRLRRGV
jgi:hypothetical protein